MFLFYNKQYPEDRLFNLSSTIDNIGINYDCIVKNNTKIMLISDPINVETKDHGKFSVVKIMADNIFCFARTDYIWDL